MGVNPRNPSSFTQATKLLPKTTTALVAYVIERCPNLLFSTLSLRLNADKGPHRDLGNSLEPSCIQVLTLETVGGNLWVANDKGSSIRVFQGRNIKGTIVECHHQPYVFSSKQVIHATDNWTGPRRLVLTAWTVMSSHNTQDVRNLLHENFGFPMPRAHKPLEGGQKTLHDLPQAAGLPLREFGIGVTFEVESSQSSQGPKEEPAPESQDSFTPTPEDTEG